MTDTDTEYSASDETVQPSSDASDTATTDGGDAFVEPVASDDSEATVVVSQAELNELSDFLTTMRDFILQHESRLAGIEAILQLAAQDAEKKIEVVGGLASSIKTRNAK
jgi:hypothetical protein